MQRLVQLCICSYFWHDPGCMLWSLILLYIYWMYIAYNHWPYTETVDWNNQVSIYKYYIRTNCPQRQSRSSQARWLRGQNPMSQIVSTHRCWRSANGPTDFVYRSDRWRVLLYIGRKLFAKHHRTNKQSIMSSSISERARNHTVLICPYIE